MATFVIRTVVATIAGYQINGEWLEKHRHEGKYRKAQIDRQLPALLFAKRVATGCVTLNERNSPFCRRQLLHMRHRNDYSLPFIRGDAIIFLIAFYL